MPRSPLVLLMMLASLGCSSSPARTAAEAGGAPGVNAGKDAAGSTLPGSAGLQGAAGQGSRAGSVAAGTGGAGAQGPAPVGGSAGVVPAAGSTATAGRPGALPACSGAVGSCPAHSVGVWQPLIQSADFGPSARLLASGGRGVLVALGDGRHRVARIHDPDAAASGAYASWEFAPPSGTQRPLAITEGQLEQGAASLLFVLTCAEKGDECSVWRAEPNEGQPLSWQSSALPADAVVNGLQLDAGPDGSQLCVYGHGMLCGRDTWQVVVPAEAGSSILAVALGHQLSLAVGEHGQWWKRERDGAGALRPWQRQPALADVALSQTSVAGDGGVIVGAGKLQAVVGGQSELYDCGAAEDLAAFILDPGFRGLSYLVTRGGMVLQHAPLSAEHPESYCAYQQLTLTAQIVGGGAAPCAASNNPRVLTQAALLGTQQCLNVQ